MGRSPWGEVGRVIKWTILETVVKIEGVEVNLERNGKGEQRNF